MSKLEKWTLRLLSIWLFTLLGFLSSPLIGVMLFDSLKAGWPIAMSGSLSIAVIFQHFFLKKSDKKFNLAKENLSLIVDLIRINNIDINIENIINSTITKETTKIENTTSNEKQTTINRFYLLDNEEQIRVLKEVRKTILDENNKQQTISSLYLEENIDENKLPVKIEKKLVYKN